MGILKSGRKRASYWRRWVRQFGPVCFYCQVRIDRFETRPRYQATLDHLVPRSRGGTSRQENLVWSCRRCNETKDDKDWGLPHPFL